MRNIIICLAIVGIMFQAGCSLTQVEHEESSVAFGSSNRLAIHQQTYNPEAGGDAPVVGLDGRYAAEVAKSYNEGPKVDPDKGQSVSEIIIGAN